MIFIRCCSILKCKRLSFGVVFFSCKLRIDVKEDGIPLEVVQYFSASGGSLVSISVSEHADFEKAVYYAVTTIITFKN